MSPPTPLPPPHPPLVRSFFRGRTLPAGLAHGACPPSQPRSDSRGILAGYHSGPRLAPPVPSSSGLFILGKKRLAQETTSISGRIEARVPAAVVRVAGGWLERLAFRGRAPCLETKFSKAYPHYRIVELGLHLGVRMLHYVSHVCSFLACGVSSPP